MSNILYYSNYCENSKNLLRNLSRSKIQEDLHYICIDKRIKQPNGKIYILLKNGQQIILPPTVTKVPALLQLNRGNNVLFGEQIYQHLQPRENSFNSQATLNNGEPQAFSLSNMSSGIASDNFSFLNMSSDELLAKGSGGTRQMFHYETINNSQCIETPPDSYVPSKIGNENVTLSNIQEKREREINDLIKNKPMPI